MSAINNEQLELGRLVDVLIKNYFDASFDFNGVQTDIDYLIDKLLQEEHQYFVRDQPTTRNVLIVGAGTSFDLYKDLLLGDDFKKHIKKSLGWNLVEYHAGRDGKRLNGESELQKLVDSTDARVQYLFFKLVTDPDHFLSQYNSIWPDSLAKMMGLDRDQATEFLELAKTFLKDSKTLHGKLSNWLVEEERILLSPYDREVMHVLDFELTLYLLSKTYSIKDIRDVIQRVYGNKNRPGLSYEVIAHMLKHRIIDVVVNFNFDELLDQAIEEELGASDYHRVLSDGDCENLLSWLVKNKVKTPIYIKPHGTSSVRSSLKFTKEDYFRVPAKMQSLLRDIFSGKTLDQGNKEVNIITAGYAMASTEINELLKASIKETKTNFFHINIDDDIDVETRRNLDLKEDDTSISQYKIVPKQNISITLDQLFHKIRDGYNDGFKPHGIWRSKIVCALFYEESLKRRTPEDDRSYFLFRTLIEITISIAIHKGSINILELSSGRAGKYYSMFKQRFKIENPKSTGVASLAYFLEHYFGLVEQRFPYYTPRYKNDFHLDLSSQRSVNVFIQDLWARWINSLNDVKSVVMPETFEKFKMHVRMKKNSVIGYLSDITRHSSYVVSPKFNDPYFNIHYHHEPDKVLNTRLALKSNLSKSIEQPDWDILLMAARRGSLFMNSSFKVPDGKKIIMILSEDSYVDELQKRYSKFLHSIRFINIELIEFHMSLFMTLDKPQKQNELSFENEYYQGKPLSSEFGLYVSKAIYFKKNRDSSEINPILFEENNPLNTRGLENKLSSVRTFNPDREDLLLIFFRYVQSCGFKGSYSDWLNNLSEIASNKL